MRSLAVVPAHEAGATEARKDSLSRWDMLLRRSTGDVSVLWRAMPCKHPCERPGAWGVELVDPRADPRAW